MSFEELDIDHFIFGFFTFFTAIFKILQLN